MKSPWHSVISRNYILKESLCFETIRGRNAQLSKGTRLRYLGVNTEGDVLFEHDDKLLLFTDDYDILDAILRLEE